AQEERPKLATAHAIAQYLRPRLSHLTHEEFHVLCFNSRNVLVADVCAAKGGLATCVVDPASLFRQVLQVATATALVFAHNHPSGAPEPSIQDIGLTKHLCEGADYLSVRVLDHIIIGGRDYVSFMEQG
ncbi:JAB domain-containing protein, partial [Corallococcus terminator]